VAQALDVIEAHGADVRSAAGALGCSTTQLVKLLKLEPRSLARVNGRRAELGLVPLR
jgi:hypothetical protein